MKIKAIYFDCDGTLLDTLQDIHEALNHTLKELGLPNVTKDQTRSFIGNGLRNLLRKALNSEDVDFALARFHHYYDANLIEHSVPYEGILEFLDELRTMGITLGMISNKTDRYIQRLTKHFFAEKFDVVLGERMDLRRKPYRDMLDYALNQTSHSIEEIIFVGDSLVDAAFIKEHQLKGALVTYGFDDEDVLRSTGLPCFSDVRSLRNWILPQISS